MFGIPLPLVALLIVENSRSNLSVLFRIIEKGKIQVVHYCVNADLLYRVKLWVLTRKVNTS